MFGITLSLWGTNSSTSLVESPPGFKPTMPEWSTWNLSRWSIQATCSTTALEFLIFGEQRNFWCNKRFHTRNVSESLLAWSVLQWVGAQITLSLREPASSVRSSSDEDTRWSTTYNYMTVSSWLQQLMLQEDASNWLYNPQPHLCMVQTVCKNHVLESLNFPISLLRCALDVDRRTVLGAQTLFNLTVIRFCFKLF